MAMLILTSHATAMTAVTATTTQNMMPFPTV
jgi:hypothetical protein